MPSVVDTKCTYITDLTDPNQLSPANRFNSTGAGSTNPFS